MGQACTRGVASATNNASAEAEPTVASSFKYQKGTCALEYWEPVKLLGEGSISSIYLVRRRDHRVDIPYKERADIMSVARKAKEMSQEIDDKDSDKPLYALKSIMKDHVRNDVYLEEMRNEIYTMSRLHHPNIVEVYEAYERKRHIYLIMEYCSGGDLVGVHSTERQATSIVRKILSAVAYLHKHKVVHRDLKLENIMFASNEPDAEVKIIDFGLATKYLSDEYKNMTDRVGTIYTMAPQVLQGVYTYKCDLWSIGVISYMLLSGENPFWGPRRYLSWPERRKIMVDRIMRCQYMRMEGGAWDNISNEAKAFVNCLLQIDPKKRPTAEKALKLAWMRKQFPPSHDDGNLLVESVSRYSKEAKLKRIALTTIAYKSSVDDIAELKSLFEKYDSSNEGRISLGDFRKALSESKLSENDVESIFAELDLDMSGYIEYAQLIAVTLETRGRIETERIAEAFDRLDVEKKGHISKENLRAILGENVSDELLTEIMEEVDADDHGQVSYEKFMDLFGMENVQRIDSAYGCAGSEEKLTNDEQELVDESNTVIPGGKHDPNQKPKYVYDRRSNSVQKLA